MRDCLERTAMGHVSLRWHRARVSLLATNATTASACREMAHLRGVSPPADGDGKLRRSREFRLARTGASCSARSLSWRWRCQERPRLASPRLAMHEARGAERSFVTSRSSSSSGGARSLTRRSDRDERRVRSRTTHNGYGNFSFGPDCAIPRPNQRTVTVASSNAGFALV